MQTREVVIVSACRTAIGKFQGQFKDVSARELAITAGKEAIKRAGIDINTIDEVVMGECYPGMQGSLPARQVSMRIGLPLESSAVTVMTELRFRPARHGNCLPERHPGQD